MNAQPDFNDLDQAAAAFEAAWSAGPVDLAAFAAEHSVDGAALLELVKIDLGRRWRGAADAGATLASLGSTESSDLRLLLEDYYRELPALGDFALAPLELIAEEFYVRTRWGDAPDVASYVARFPDRAEELPGALDEMLRRVADETPPAGAASATFQPRSVRYFGDYEILDEIARGGMGVVYHARQVSLNRPVALKMILSGALASREEIQRFRREAEAAANLQHPGIVSIYEVGEHDGRQYFSMEYIAGKTLSAWAREQRPSPREAAEIVARIAEAIACAHEQGVLHRDVKPSNVLVDAAGAVHVTDFGLAKSLGSDAELTHTGQAIGTPSYMPPEQIHGVREFVGPRSDVYSLGAVLYELLVGRPPFTGDGVMDVLRQVLDDDPAPVRKLSSGVPRDLETICLKCLHKQPSHRYAGAAELAADLRRFLEHRPIAARRTGPAGRVARWVRRRPRTAVGAAVVALACAAAGWFYAESQRISQSAGATIADVEGRLLEKDELQRAERYYEQIRNAQAAIKEGELDRADAVLEACDEDLRHWEWRYLKRAAHPELYRIECEGVVSGDVAEDGSFVAFGLNDGQIALFAIESESERIRFPAHPGPVTAVSIRYDGAQIAAGGADGAIRIFDANTGDQIQELVAAGGDQSAIRDVRFSPQGAFVASHDGLSVWRVSDGQRLETAGSGDFIGALAEGLAGVGSTVMAEVMASTLSGPSEDDLLLALGEDPNAVEGYAQGVRASFSFDERLVAFVGAFGNRVIVRDLQTGEQIAELSRGEWALQDVEFVPIPVKERNLLRTIMYAEQGRSPHGLSAYTLAVVDGRGEVALWSPADNRPYARMQFDSIFQSSYYRLAVDLPGETLSVVDAEGRTASVRLLRHLHQAPEEEFQTAFYGQYLTLGGSFPLKARSIVRDAPFCLGGDWACLVHDDGASVLSVRHGVNEMMGEFVGGATIPWVQLGQDSDNRFAQIANRVYGMEVTPLALPDDGEIMGEFITSPLAPSYLLLRVEQDEEASYDFSSGDEAVVPIEEAPEAQETAAPKMARSIVELRSAASGELLKATDPIDDVFEAAFAPDGSAAAFCSSLDRYRRLVEVHGTKATPRASLEVRPAGTVFVWDSATGEERFRAEGVRYAGFSFSGDSRLIAVPRHRELVIHQVKDGRVVFQADAPADRHAVEVQFARERSLCAVVWRSDEQANDELIAVWDVATGREVGQIRPPSNVNRGGVIDMVFSPNDDLLLAWYQNLSVEMTQTQVWRISDATLLATLEGKIHANSFSNDGERVVTLSGVGLHLASARTLRNIVTIASDTLESGTQSRLHVNEGPSAGIFGMDLQPTVIGFTKDDAHVYAVLPSYGEGVVLNGLPLDAVHAANEEVYRDLAEVWRLSQAAADPWSSTESLSTNDNADAADWSPYDDFKNGILTGEYRYDSDSELGEAPATGAPNEDFVPPPPPADPEA